MPKYLNIDRELSLQLAFTFVLFFGYETSERFSGYVFPKSLKCLILGINFDFITDLLRAGAFGFILTHYSRNHSFLKNTFLNDIAVLEEFCLLPDCRAYFSLYLSCKHPLLKKSFDSQLHAYEDDSVANHSCYGDHFRSDILHAFNQFKKTTSFRSLDRRVRENAHVMARGFEVDS